MTTVRECSTPADHDEAWRLRSIAFGGPRTPTPGWEDEGWRGWVAADGGRVCGFARVWPMRQFFGGVAVPMAGLASVAVDPYARGRGVASTLLATALPAMRDAGQPISVLYPSVLPLYRGHGWEQVGVYETVDVSPHLLRSVPAPAAPVSLRPVTEADVPALRACYLTLASTVDGLLDRSAPPFELSSVPSSDVATIVDGPDGPRGYLAADRGEPGLDVQELVALDADALRALVASLASWSGAVSAVRLALSQPRALFPTMLGSTVSSEQWMLRVVDLPAAVTARGWPLAARLRPGLAVDVDVVDEQAPWHAGPHRIACEDGHVTATRGGSGAVTLTARALAAWYAGSASTVALHRAGLLRGDLAAAAVLDALTGVPGPPRLADSF